MTPLETPSFSSADSRDPEALARFRDGFLEKFAELTVAQKGRLDIANDTVRILLETAPLTPANSETGTDYEKNAVISAEKRAQLKPIPLSPALMAHMETEMGGIGSDERWAHLAVVESSRPFDQWDQVVWGEGPDGELIALHIKYGDGGKVAALQANEVNVSDQ